LLFFLDGVMGALGGGTPGWWTLVLLARPLLLPLSLLCAGETSASDMVVVIGFSHRDLQDFGHSFC
jgi:hypothetical protein